MVTRSKVGLEIPYVAGLFDGEGCVNIYRKEKLVTKIGYELSVSIYNCNREVIQKLHEELGGYFQIRTRTDKNYRTAYSWKVGGNQALDFLKKVQPFLVVKREQAKAAIEFQELKKSKRFRFLRNIKEIDDFYEICYQKMRILNKKGVLPYYEQRLNEETLKREAIVRSALKNAERGRDDLSALREQNKEGGYATLKKYGVDHYREMRSKVRK